MGDSRRPRLDALPRRARQRPPRRADRESYRTTIALAPDDRIFCAIPLGHSYATGACLFAFACSGATLVLLDDPNPFVLRRGRALELIQRHRATIFPGVPFNFRL